MDITGRSDTTVTNSTGDGDMDGGSTSRDTVFNSDGIPANGRYSNPDAGESSGNRFRFPRSPVGQDHIGNDGRSLADTHVNGSDDGQSNDETSNGSGDGGQGAIPEGDSGNDKHPQEIEPRVSHEESEVKPKREMPEWLLERFRGGNEFNRRREPYYSGRGGVNELYVGERTPNGHYRSVDSYVPGEEIVSRKFTQLSDVQESTVIRYLEYQAAYYSPGTVIPDLPSTRHKLEQNPVKITIEGDMILEVPVQNSPPPRGILEKAEDLQITIRDENGLVWNLDDLDDASVTSTTEGVSGE
jgi:hypothetical protein